MFQLNSTVRHFGLARFASPVVKSEPIPLPTINLFHTLHFATFPSDSISTHSQFQIKVWYIPEGGLKTNLTEWIADMHGHKRRVGYIEWHPTAENVIASVGFDYLVSSLVWVMFYENNSRYSNYPLHHSEIANDYLVNPNLLHKSSSFVTIKLLPC